MTDITKTDIATMAPAEDRFIGEAECKRITNLSRTTRWRLENSGNFPARRQISQSRVAWLRSEIMAWLESRVR